MPKILQFRRYPTANVITITGSPGEVIVDNTYNILTVHDGVTVGGTRVATEINLNNVNNYAQSAFNKANTSGSVPNYLPNSILFANATGYSSNTANLKFLTSNNTVVTYNVYTTGSIIFQDGTVQTTAASGAASDTTARLLGAAANVYANAAFAQANQAYAKANSAAANTLYQVANGRLYVSLSTGSVIDISTTPAGNTYYVATNGNDALDGQTPATAKATVRAAVAASNPGDTVYIFSGTFTETTPIIIPQQVQITGAGERNTIIQPITPSNDIFWVNNNSYVTAVKFANYSGNAIAFPASTIETGTAASGSTNTITLSGAQPYNNYYNTMLITITGGLGAGQSANVISYVGSTQVATIDKNWTTIPNNTSTYSFSIPLRYTPAAANSRYSTYITGSPYIYNSSSITTLGGTGLCIDGYRATGNKSMISSQFTQVNTGGTGVKIINDAYAQLVSIYGIFCNRAFWADTGGTASMGNCNVNFGNIGLYANGFGNVVMTAQLNGTQSANNYTMNLKSITANSALSVSANVPYSGLLAYISGDLPGFYYTVSSATPLVGGNTTVTFAAANSNVFTTGTTVTFYQQSQLRASGQTFEYVGAGTTINAIPRLGGLANSQQQIVYANGGIVFATSTDENGNFQVGDLVLNQATSTISGRTFNKSLFAVMTPYILALEQ
jgi:hypothetical protein